VEEAALLGPANPAEGIAAGVCAWEHGFVFRALRLQAGATIPEHTRSEEEVIFVQRGQLQVEVDGQALQMKQGDTFTTPIGSSRSFANKGSEACICYITRRGNQPAAPVFA